MNWALDRPGGLSSGAGKIPAVPRTLARVII